jgi:hypothetical protein
MTKDVLIHGLALQMKAQPATAFAFMAFGTDRIE